MSISNDVFEIRSSEHFFLNLTNAQQLAYFQELCQDSHIRKVNPILSQVKDLLKLRNPSTPYSAQALEEKAHQFLEENGGDSYGNWVFYPWRNTLVHLLPEKEFAEVRTIRNKYKITHEEQEQLTQKKIGVVGLSVGQSVALALSLERTFGELRIADFDTLELSNLNRIRTGVHNLGEKKTTIVSREIAEIDPYLKVTVFEEGVTEGNIDRFLLDGGKLDILIDECDSLDMKLLMRERARYFHIPVIMDTSDRGMLDVERFDVEPDREIFHGLVQGLDYRLLKDLPMKERIPIVLKITGLETLSTRMKASLLEVNQSITSWPQLASSVFLGGALAAHASKEILLDNPLDSGRFYVDFDELLVPIEKEAFSQQDVLDTQKTVQLKEKFLAKTTRSSQYLLSDAELESMLTYANLAPSGGNVQPWFWIFDERGVLHLMHDQERSKALLDFKGTGSLMAFGAALENLRIWCHYHGILHTIVYTIQAFEDTAIASVVFEGKQSEAIASPFVELYEYIPLRVTDRLNQGRKPIPEAILQDFYQIGNQSDIGLDLFSLEADIRTLASINGRMDWVRMINKTGYEDFLSEIRWTPEQALATGDGIDLATFDFGPAEKSLMKLISNRQAMQVIRKFKLGQGFTKISDDTFNSASVIGIVSAKDFTPEAYLQAGAILQRIWIMAAKYHISFQPVTAALFMFHRYTKGGEKDFSLFEQNLMDSCLQDLNALVNPHDRELLFMFRLSLSDGKVVKSHRRPIQETYKKVTHV
jgi:tRNA A37 threonylcarbamoyladenosine dehydratase